MLSGWFVIKLIHLESTLDHLGSVAEQRSHWKRNREDDWVLQKCMFILSHYQGLCGSGQQNVHAFFSCRLWPRCNGCEAFFLLPIHNALTPDHWNLIFLYLQVGWGPLIVSKNMHKGFCGCHAECHLSLPKLMTELYRIGLLILWCPFSGPLAGPQTQSDCC